MDNVAQLNIILKSFKIHATCTNYKEYKNAQVYDLKLTTGGKLKEIEKHLSEIGLSLKSYSKPNMTILSDQGIIQIECLKSKLSKNSLFESLYKSPKPDYKLPCLLGESLTGEKIWMDIVSNPHMIVAGSTGSGKSTILHSIIGNLLFQNNVHLFLIDPKNIEFHPYTNSMSHKMNIYHDYKDACSVLQYLVGHMEFRYEVMRSSNTVFDFPYMVLIIDEFADLIAQDTENKLYPLLAKLAQKSRAAGIHMIISTQRPSVDVINGLIKANFPARLSCKVASHVDSKIILDSSGAECLLGKGDSIINNSEYNLQRFQACYTNPQEIIEAFKNI